MGGEAKKYKDRYKIDLKKAFIQYKKDQIKNVQYFIKYQEEFKEEDIRKFSIGNKNKMQCAEKRINRDR